MRQVDYCVCDRVINQPPIDGPRPLLRGDWKPSLFQHLQIALDGSLGNAQFGAKLLQRSALAAQQVRQPQDPRYLIASHASQSIASG